MDDDISCLENMLFVFWLFINVFCNRSDSIKVNKLRYSVFHPELLRYPTEVYAALDEIEIWRNGIRFTTKFLCSAG